MVVVTISGPSGSGKSTAGKLLAGRLNLKYHSVGDFFRSKAKEAGKDIKEFMTDAPDGLHLEADKHVGELASKGNAIIDGRLSGFMAPDADFRICLVAPIEVRAERTKKRKGLTRADAVRRLEERDAHDKETYKDIYNINTDDLSIYDLVLNTEHFGRNDVADILEKAVRTAMGV